MQKLTFNTFINAPVEKVWNTMLGDATYREWTMAFHEGSYYMGSWEKGSKILFLGPDEGGGVGGMVGQIAENRPHEFISIEHRGFVKGGVEDYDSEEVKKWVPAFENYTFTSKDGGTELLIEVDTNEEYSKMFSEMWPRALAKLKEVAER